jgi:hypothetical protein
MGPRGDFKSRITVIHLDRSGITLEIRLSLVRKDSLADRSQDREMLYFPTPSPVITDHLRRGPRSGLHLSPVSPHCVVTQAPALPRLGKETGRSPLRPHSIKSRIWSSFSTSQFNPISPAGSGQSKTKTEHGVWGSRVSVLSSRPTEWAGDYRVYLLLFISPFCDF